MTSEETVRSLPPFVWADITDEAAFDNAMEQAVMASAINTFRSNLWGLAMTADLTTRMVDAYLFFDSEPTDLDRFMISEFAFSFDCQAEWGEAVRIHRTVMPRVDYIPLVGEMRWIHLELHPSAELPDDVGFDELDY